MELDRIKIDGHTNTWSKIECHNIATWMIEDGTTNTDNGSWCIYSEEIARKFNIPEEWVIEHQKDICEEVDSHQEILSETWTSVTEDVVVFDMNFCLSACKNWDGTEDWGC